MAVLVQDLTTPYLSFVAHTVSPIPQTKIAKAIDLFASKSKLTSDPTEWVYVEFALGLGEILASGSVGGAPFRVLIHKNSGKLGQLLLHIMWQRNYPF